MDGEEEPIVAFFGKVDKIKRDSREHKNRSKAEKILQAKNTKAFVKNHVK